MREETLINAVNDIDDIRWKLEDIHQDIMEQPDYWTKLHHQAAIAAMQGIMTNIVGFESVRTQENASEVAAEIAKDYASALVNRLKEEEK